MAKIADNHAVVEAVGKALDTTARGSLQIAETIGSAVTTGAVKGAFALFRIGFDSPELNSMEGLVVGGVETVNSVAKTAANTAYDLTSDVVKSTYGGITRA